MMSRPPGEISAKQALRDGFTLIEMSIVLVVIGLIVGGVLVGRDMIVQAELRRVVKDVELYKAAVNAFRDKYNCIPGDCANATTFFGLASKGCWNWNGLINAGPILATGGTGTCNGDGNGVVSQVYEPTLVWNHLALSGIVPGNYTGTLGQSNGQFGLQAGFNVPYTIRNGGIEMMTYWLGDTSTAYSANAFAVGAVTNGMGTYGAGADQNWAAGIGGLLTPSEAYQIDLKFDDGGALTGNITGGPWYSQTGGPVCNAGAHVAFGGNVYT